MAKPRPLPNEAAEAPVAPEKPDYLHHRERLRDRLLGGGTDALPDYELLEFLHYSAQARRDTKPLAKALLKRFGGLPNVLGADREALKAVPGMGDASVAALLAVRAAAARFLRGELAQREIVSS
jgi:DNA repair protein RadC